VGIFLAGCRFSAAVAVFPAIVPRRKRQKETRKQTNTVGFGWWIMVDSPSQVPGIGAFVMA
jgi:preprotein translocase subunit YajC